MPVVTGSPFLSWLCAQIVSIVASLIEAHFAGAGIGTAATYAGSLHTIEHLRSATLSKKGS